MIPVFLDNLFKVNKVLLCVIGKRGLFICYIANRMINDTKLFLLSDFENYNNKEISDYFQRYPNVPIRVIFDTDQQYFVAKNIQKNIKKQDKINLLNAKLKSDIPYEGIKGFQKILSIENSKTDEYLLTCVTISPSIQPFMELLENLPNPVFSFHSLPLELYELVIFYNYLRHNQQQSKKHPKNPKSKDKAHTSPSFTYDSTKSLNQIRNTESSSKEWSIALSLTETRGLRQVVVFGASFVLNRTTYLEDLNSKQSFDKIKEEVESTIKYVEKSSFLPRDKIRLIVFGSAEFCNLMSNMDLGAIRLDLELLSTFTKSVKLLNFSQQYNYVSLLAICSRVRSFPSDTLKNAKTNLSTKLYNIFKYTKILGITTILTLLIILTYLFATVQLSQSNLKLLNVTKSNLANSLMQELKSTPDNFETKNKIVSFFTSKPNEYSYTSENIFKRVNTVISQFENVHLDNISILCSNQCKDLSDFIVDMTVIYKEKDLYFRDQILEQFIKEFKDFTLTSNTSNSGNLILHLVLNKND